MFGRRIPVGASRLLGSGALSGPLALAGGAGRVRSQGLLRFLNRHAVDPTLMTGKFTKFTDRNGDGDFDDEGEAERWFSHLFSHNALQTSATRRNKVSSPSDVLLRRDERVFVTMHGCGRQTGKVIPFIPGDAKAVRVDSETGRFADEITDLTTAVDVAMDDRGNIFVVGMAYADLLPKLFNLFDPDAPPLHSSYLRLGGGVTLYPATRAIPPGLLVEGLDMATNITLGPDAALYASTGQGTPGRSVPGPDEPPKIVGEVVQITNDPSGAGE